MKEGERIHAAHRVPLTDLQLSVCLQALEECQYELVVPLAIMFSSTLLQVQIRSPPVGHFASFKVHWLLPNHSYNLLSC